MQIPVNKNSLASALNALGKLVSRTSLIRTYQAIQIEGKANMLYFRTRNVTEEIEFRLFAELEEDFPTTLVEFEQFRLAIRNCKNKTLKLEIDNGEVFIEGVKLAPVDGHFPVPEIIPDQDVCVTELPADTLSALEKLAPIADKGQDVRKVLRGINISKDGFTAANAKELSNIPFQLKMARSITIPFPLALLATKAFGEAGRLSTWPSDDETHFEFTIGSWSWRATAFKENYPNWKLVVPTRTDKTHYVSFQQDRAEMFQRYLRGVPDDPKKPTTIKLSRLAEVPDNLQLESSNGMLFSICAEFDPNWGDLIFGVRKDILAHLLSEGHTRIEINDALSPLVGTGGMGQYVAMPVFDKKMQAQTEQKANESAPVQTKIQPAVQNEQPAPQTTEPSTEQIPSHKQETTPQTIPNTTTPIKERNTMNEKPVITHTVSVNMQTLAQNNEPTNPIDELTAKIEAMKSALKEMIDEAAAMGRTIREVAISQRQKDREYNQTKRALERIRVASGAA